MTAQPKTDAELYGRSPMMDALPALRAWGALSPEERAAAIREVMRLIEAEEADDYG